MSVIWTVCSLFQECAESVNCIKNVLCYYKRQKKKGKIIEKDFFILLRVIILCYDWLADNYMYDAI